MRLSDIKGGQLLEVVDELYVKRKDGSQMIMQEGYLLVLSRADNLYKDRACRVLLDSSGVLQVSAWKIDASCRVASGRSTC